MADNVADFPPMTLDPRPVVLHGAVASNPPWNPRQGYPEPHQALGPVPDWSPALKLKPYQPYEPNKPPTPRTIPLPLGGNALMFAREQLTVLFRCSHGELGRLIKARLAPSPIRIDGQILWFCDEALNVQAQVERTLNRWRKR